MNQGRARVEASLRRVRARRPPCFPLVDLAYASAHAGINMKRVQLDPLLHAHALARCLRELPIDGVYVNLCFTADQAANRTSDGESDSVLLDDCIEVRLPPNDVAAIASTLIQNLLDPRIDTAQLFHPGMLATFQELNARSGATAAIFAGLTGTFSQLGFLIGLENLLLALMDQPEQVEAALQRRHRVALGQAAALCRAGARFIWIGEGMASGSLISPAAYRRFVLPYEQELADEIHRHGSYCLLHICGNTTPMLPLLATCHADGCDIDSPTDWSAAVHVLQPTLVIKGNVNPSLFLPQNIAGLADACIQAKRLADPRPGFILSSGCLVPRDSSPEAFEIFASASATPVPGASGTAPSQSVGR